MIDWIQIATVGGGVLTVIVSIGTAVRWLDSRINHLNDKSEVRLEKTIKEWRDEHSNQIDKLDRSLQQNEAHWREMFTHFNTRLDKIVEPK